MEERLQASASQRKVFRETGIRSVEELMYADLRHAGWEKPDAFYAVYRDRYITYPRREITAMIERMERDNFIMHRIQGSDPNGESLSGEVLARETSKEKILSDLLIARKRTREGTKEWNDLTKMIADYAKIKQDDIKIDDQPIRYYLPVHYPTSCKDCLIGKKMRESKKV